jgi:hypothetical protein
MINDTTTADTPAPAPVTAEIAKAKISLALTGAEMSIQAMQTKVDTLVYNEDNLPAIKETVLAIGKIEKKIEEAFAAGKAPYLEGGRAWDAAKRDLMALISPISTKVTQQHTKLCQAVEARKRAEKLAEDRKIAIVGAITATILGFSQEITACKTSAELVSIQARINAEQGKKSTYGEYLPTLIERCGELNQPLKDQKAAIKALEELKLAEEEAVATGDDEKLMEIQDKKEQIEDKVQENRVKVEESAINSSTRYTGGSGYRESFPEVKTKRKVWKTQLVDAKEAVKKEFLLLKVELNPELVKIKLKTLQETGALQEGVEGKEDVIIGGIRYYLDKTY